MRRRLALKTGHLRSIPDTDIAAYGRPRLVYPCLASREEIWRRLSRGRSAWSAFAAGVRVQAARHEAREAKDAVSAKTAAIRA